MREHNNKAQGPLLDGRRQECSLASWLQWIQGSFECSFVGPLVRLLDKDDNEVAVIELVQGDNVSEIGSQKDEWPQICITDDEAISPTDKQKSCVSPRKFHLAQVSLILILLIAFAGPSKASTLTDFDGATFYKAPVGSRIRVACNGSHWSEDSVSLVLWFKGTIERHSVPIYTVDARQKPLNNGARHLVADNYKGRAKFVTKASPPYLDLGPLEADDQSEYRCRIDYRSKPRENFLIILFVLVPPRSVQVMDSNGRSLEQIYGPLSEDSDLTLLCLSKGGRPAPSVTWRRRKKVIDDSYLTINDFLALKQSGQFLASANQSRDHYGNENSTKNQSEQATFQHHQQQQQQAFGQLESLWREWQSWPEFDYFDHQVRRLFGRSNKNHPPPDGSNNSSGHQPTDSYAPSARLHAAPFAAEAESQRKLSTGSGSSGSLFNGRQTVIAPAKLLTLQVHDSITTSVNVLRLGGLSLQAGAGRMLDDSGGGRPVLECEASNLHYDLRSLIKLFAPPSLTTASTFVRLQQQQQTVHPMRPPLAAPNPSGQTSGAGSSDAAAEPGDGGSAVNLEQENEWPPSQSQVNPATRDQLGRQLVEAIEGAFEASLRRPDGVSVAAEWPASVASASGQQQHQDDNNSSIQPQKQATASGETSGSLADPSTALSQIKTEASSLFSLNSTGSQQQQSASSLFAPANPRRQAEVANLIYSHLARPHLLSGGSLLEQQTNNQLGPSSSGDPDAESPDSADSSGQQTDKQAAGQAPNPLVRSKLIALDVYFRPLDVKIIGPQRPLSAGQLAEFGCTSSGSRPPATLNWLKNGHQLDKSLQRQIIEPNGNVSHSKLSIRLEPQDHGAQLTCRAENEPLGRLAPTTNPLGSPMLHGTQPVPDNNNNNNNNNDDNNNNSTGNSGDAEEANADVTGSGSLTSPGHALEESRTLVVHYAPRVKLELGNKMLSTDTREGSDIYFVCHVEAQPPAKEITWLHNERLINETSGDGLIVSNNSLVLQKVRLDQRGNYVCMASNSEGITESNRLELRVLHAPTCAAARRGPEPGESRSRGPVLVARRRLALRARARLLCPMEADPPELEVSWYLDNNSRPSERRLVAASSAKSPQLAGSLNANNNNATTTISQLGKAQPTQTTTATSKKTVSQLSYTVDTAADYGQLHCFARNSVGEQKRPCLYEILPPEPEDAPGLSCLAANVTSGAAWVACDRPQLGQGGESDDDGDSNGQQDSQETHELGFSIELYSFDGGRPQDWQQAAESDFAGAGFVAGDEPQSGDPDDLGGPGGGQLEANLSLGPIEEPMFSVNNLRPATRYALHVRAISGPIVSQAAVVRFETTSAEEQQAALTRQQQQQAAAASSGRRRLEPSAEPISGQHHSGLLSALISTRSTNLGRQTAPAKSRQELLVSDGKSGQNAPARPPIYQEHKQQRQQQPARSSLSQLWSSLVSQAGKLVSWPRTSASSASDAANRAGQSQAGQRTSAHNRLMDVSDALLVASVSLLLLASLVAMLLLHRRSKLQSARKSHQQQKPDRAKKMDEPSARQLHQQQQQKDRKASALACGDEMMMMMQLAEPDNNRNAGDPMQLEASIDLMRLQPQQPKGNKTQAASASSSSNNCSPHRTIDSDSVVLPAAGRGNLMAGNPSLGYAAGQTAAANQSIGKQSQQQQNMHANSTLDRLAHFQPASSALNIAGQLTSNNNYTALASVDPMLRPSSFSQTGSLLRASRRQSGACMGSSACATLDVSRRARLGSVSREPGQVAHTFELAQSGHSNLDGFIATLGSCGQSGPQHQVYGATPIRATKSRSSLCFESLLMSAGDALELKQQQKQQDQQLRLIQLSGHIDGRLISDANLKLDGDHLGQLHFAGAASELDDCGATRRPGEMVQLAPGGGCGPSFQLQHYQTNDDLSHLHLDMAASGQPSGPELLFEPAEGYRDGNGALIGALSGSIGIGQALSGLGQQQQHSLAAAMDSGINESSSSGSGSGSGSDSRREVRHASATEGGQLSMIGTDNLLATEQQRRQLFGPHKNQYSQGKQRGQQTAYAANGSMSRILRHHKPLVNQQQQQQQQQSLDLQSSSLISDESSDSNAHCTWSLANGEIEGQQMHFIELVPALGQANGNGNQCLEVDLMGKLLGSNGSTSNFRALDNDIYNHDNQKSALHQYHNQNQQQLTTKAFNCPSLTSSSIGSSSVKDQAISSPLSMTTLSNTDSLGLVNNGTSKQQESTTEPTISNGSLEVARISASWRHDDGGKIANHVPNHHSNTGPIISILKNSSNSNKFHQQPNVCQCNGKEPTIKLEERL